MDGWMDGSIDRWMDGWLAECKTVAILNLTLHKLPNNISVIQRPFISKKQQFFPVNCRNVAADSI
jgi:hypothetical protein